MSREVTDEQSEGLGRRTSASVSRETVRWARRHDGALRQIRNWSPRQTGSTWEPQARQRRGSPSPGSGGLSSCEDHPSRALECSSQDHSTRFPVELHRGASQPKPALHKWHHLLAQASCGTRSISAPTAEAVENLPRGARCFPRNHEEQRHLLTPLPQGCTQLWTSAPRWSSAVHRVVHNGGQAPLSTLACTDGTGNTPRCGVM